MKKRASIHTTRPHKKKKNERSMNEWFDFFKQRRVNELDIDSVEKTEEKKPCTVNDIANQNVQKLRKNITNSENKFKQMLLNKQISFKFQKIIFSVHTKDKFYIADFYLPEYHTFVEIDGDYHNTPEQMDKDIEREEDIFDSIPGCRILRFSNDFIDNNSLEVIHNLLNDNLNCKK